MRHAATVRDVGAPKEEPKFLVRLAATATSGTGAIDGDSSGSHRTSVPEAQILGASTPNPPVQVSRGRAETCASQEPRLAYLSCSTRAPASRLATKKSILNLQAP